jgi:uncharacterized membrane protein YvbJ
MIRCIACGNSNPNDAKFCIKCGEELIQEAKKIEIKKKVYISEEPIFCSQCNAENPEDAKFCTKCGFSLGKILEPVKQPRKKSFQQKSRKPKKSEELVYCKRCGALIPDDMDICINCGEKTLKNVKISDPATNKNTDAKSSESVSVKKLDDIKDSDNGVGVKVSDMVNIKDPNINASDSGTVKDIEVKTPDPISAKDVKVPISADVKDQSTLTTDPAPVNDSEVKTPDPVYSKKGSEVVYCDECGVRITGDEETCINCGRQLIEEKEILSTVILEEGVVVLQLKLACPNCGVKNLDDSIFCRICGERIADKIN